MIVGVLQPSYLPWLGYLEQIARSDVFVIYDDVQFEKGSWRNRNRIKTPNGPAWLTVPVYTKDKKFPLIVDVEIKQETKWNTKHIKTLRQFYGKAPFFDAYSPELFEIIERPWHKLVDLNIELLVFFMKVLGIKTRLVRSSSLGIHGKSTARLVEIVKYFGGTVFYEGATGRNYIDPALFEAAGIHLQFQDYLHPVYKQQYGDFIPYLSIVDLLFCCGPESYTICMGKET